LTTAPETGQSSQPMNGFQRAVGALRLAMPFVQRILPLLDGNVATTVSNILGPHAVQPTPVNLAPLEDGLAELQTGHRELRDQVMEQNSSLKRVEDQLEMVREATDRNTLEQQELLEDLKTVSNKVNTFAFVALVLLAVSVVLNIVLYLHIRRVLP
jgi:t-SNARE complex subunit (syntaxin)